MTTSPTIAPTAAKAGGNLAVTERTLGQELRKLVHVYDRQIEKHNEQIAAIHQTILEIGRKLRAGRALHPSPQRFKLWCQKYGMNAGPFGSQQERSAAMIIVELHDDGVAPLGLEQDVDGQDIADVDRLHLDLTNCRRTAPTNILSWARKTQPELFPHLSQKREAERRARAAKPKQAGERSYPEDDAVLIDLDVAHEVNRIGADRDAIVALQARVAELTAARKRVTACVRTFFDAFVAWNGEEDLTERTRKGEALSAAMTDLLRESGVEEDKDDEAAWGGGEP